MNPKYTRISVISIFVILYFCVSVISTIHVIDFFELSNSRILSIFLAISFEIGAMASLAALVILDKTSKTLVWSLFVLLTLFQIQGNIYYAFSHLSDSYVTWIDLFGLSEEEPIVQKRIFSFVSGAVLPLVALGFIKSLIDYIKPNNNIIVETPKNPANKILSEPSEVPTEPSEMPIEEKPKKVKVTIKKPKDKNIETKLEEISRIPKNLKTSSELTESDLKLYKEKSKIPSKNKKREL